MRSRLWYVLAPALALPVSATQSPIETRIDAIAAPYLDAGDFMGVVGTVAASDSRPGRYRDCRGGAELRVERNVHGEVVLIKPPEGTAAAGLVPLDDGAFLQPLYFQRCEQEAQTRVVTCRILSGDPRYTSEWTPVSEGAE